MASPPVREAIATQADVPFSELQVLPPLTPKQPRVLSEAGNERKTERHPEAQRPVPARGPGEPDRAVPADLRAERRTSSATALANAAVGAHAVLHLTKVAGRDPHADDEQIKLVQLGTAHGTVINNGISWRVAFLAFCVSFAVLCATVIYVRRVREGWRVASLRGRRRRRLAWSSSPSCACSGARRVYVALGLRPRAGLGFVASAGRDAAPRDRLDARGARHADSQTRRREPSAVPRSSGAPRSLGDLMGTDNTHERIARGMGIPANSSWSARPTWRSAGRRPAAARGARGRLGGAQPYHLAIQAVATAPDHHDRRQRTYPREGGEAGEPGRRGREGQGGRAHGPRRQVRRREDQPDPHPRDQHRAAQGDRRHRRHWRIHALVRGDHPVRGPAGSPPAGRGPARAPRAQPVSG